MRKFSNISNYKHLIGICFGIIAAVVILVSQTFYYDYLATAEEVTPTEIAGEDEGHPDILTISKDAVTSVVQFVLSHALHFIADIYVDNDTEVEVELDQKIDFNSYFKTLFRLIISPNAP